MKMPRLALLLASLCAPFALPAQVAGTLDAGFDSNAGATVLDLAVEPLQLPVILP